MLTISNIFPHTNGLSTKEKFCNQKKALEAASYLIEILADAVDYTTGKLEESQDQLTLEVWHISTKFSITINFGTELSLQASFNSGILQTECAKIRNFVEDLECYLKVAHFLGPNFSSQEK